jgi:TRAP-type C4-dicarboxylate transport system permease small subunit
MVLGIPLWIPYAAMVPGLALAGVLGVTQPFRRRPPARSAA